MILYQNINNIKMLLQRKRESGSSTTAITTMRALLALLLLASSAAYTLLPLRRIPVVAPSCRSAVPCMQVGDETEPPEPPVEPPAAAEESPVEADAIAEAAEVPDEAEVVEVQAAAVEEAAEEVTSEFGDVEDDVFFGEGSIAKEALKSEIADGLMGAKPDRAVVGEILLALEAQNPTQSPATSALLNGRWKFLYASGASPGLKALSLVLRGAKAAPKSPSGADLVDVGDTFLCIQPEQPRATAEVTVRLLSFENVVKLSSKLEAESAVRLVETYEEAQSEYMSLKLPLASSPASYKRSVLISYLDEEMLVVRDALGRPDVLMRVNEAGSYPLSDVDTASEDEAPGAS